MANIIWSSISLDQFKAYFCELSMAQRVKFVTSYRTEISSLKNVEILDFLCQNGYMSALPAFLKVGDRSQIVEYLIAYYKSSVSRSYPVFSENLDIQKAACQYMEVVRFLRAKTNIYVTGKIRGLSLITIYEYASNQVADYLFSYDIASRVPINPTLAPFLFRKAQPKIIENYIRKIGSFAGRRSYVNFSMLKELIDRKDVTIDRKCELILLAINHFPVSDHTISLLVKHKFLVL